MSSKHPSLSFADQCCDIAKRLHAAMSSQQATPQTFFVPKPIQETIDAAATSIRNLWPGRFGKEYLSNAILLRLRESLARPIDGTTRDQFIDLFSKFEKFDEKKLCIVPLDGVVVPKDPVFLGPFVLRRPADEDFRRIRSLFKETMGRTRHTPEEQAAFVEYMQRHFEDRLERGVLLEWEVVAEAEQAHHLFLEKANKLVDLLQMSTNIAEFCDDARIGLRGSTYNGVFTSWVLPLNSGRFIQPNRRTGCVGELLLNERNLFLMESAGMLRLAKTLGRTESPLEAALLRAVHWFAQAIRHEHPGQIVLSLVIGLESVLGSSNSRVTAESVALLLGKTPQQKRGYYQLVADAYSVRNRVVHEGTVAEVLSGEKRFRSLVRDFIGTCVGLCDELQTPADLKRRVNELRFS